jgi:outer membrane protein assembly factor BamB
VPVGQGDATPALVGDRIFVFARQGGDEVTLCLNAADGKEIWRDKYPAPAISGPAARQHSGPRSSPAVAEGKVVTLGVNGALSCLDAASSKVLWRKEEIKGVPRFYTACSPIVADGLAIAHLGAQGSGALVAYDLASGNQKWKWDAEGPGYASPVVMTAGGVKQIVTLTEKSAVGIGAADGKLLWSVPFAPKGMSYNAATPLVAGDTVIVTGQGRGTKALKIEKKGEAFAATEIWSNPEIAVQFNTPVLKDGQIFGLTDKSSLFCLNAQDGKTAWTDSAKRGAGRGFGAIVDAGSELMLLPDNSELLVYKPDAKQFAQVAAIKVADTPTIAHPVLAGKAIYIKDQENLACYSVE